MKKIVSLLILVTLSLNLYSQKIYHNKVEYEKALSQYNDELDSYENYIKKIKFYQNLRYPKTLSYDREGKFIKNIVPLMIKNNIKLDNPSNRLYPNVKSSGVTYFYYFDNPNKDYLTIWISSRDTNNYVHASEACAFNHPGKPPIFVEPEKPITNKILPVKSEQVKIDNVVIIQKEEIKKEEPLKQFLPYIMPDGKKYNTLDELVKVYPMLKEEKIFTYHFK